MLEQSPKNEHKIKALAIGWQSQIDICGFGYELFFVDGLRIQLCCIWCLWIQMQSLFCIFADSTAIGL